MSLKSRARGLAFLALPALVSVTFAQGVDISTVGVNNTRQGWNRFETVLTAANVPKLKKIREFKVDEKIDVSPLVVGGKLYVFTMTNTAFVFDVDTGAELAKRRQPDRRRQGRHPLQPRQEQSGQGQLEPPVQSALRGDLSPNQPNGPAGLPTTTAANPNWPIVNRDRNLMTQTPTGKTHHIHGTPVYMQRAKTGIVYLWGENERLKAYNFDLATKRITGFRGEGTQFASGNMPAPGGMPGGRLVGSSNGNTVGTGVIWGVYPTQGNANSNVVHGALVAYDAVVVNNGKMKQLFHSDANLANDMGNFAKYATPVVASGKVYVATFSNKVVQYGL
jgi:outer membrane protein assembly factor BamB